MYTPTKYRLASKAYVLSVTIAYVISIENCFETREFVNPTAVLRCTVTFLAILTASTLLDMLHVGCSLIFKGQWNEGGLEPNTIECSDE